MPPMFALSGPSTVPFVHVNDAGGLVPLLLVLLPPLLLVDELVLLLVVLVLVLAGSSPPQAKKARSERGEARRRGAMRMAPENDND